MRKMKLNVFALLIIFCVMFSSCSQEYYEDDFLDQDTWVDGDGEHSSDDENGQDDGFVKLTAYKINGNDLFKIKDFDVSGAMQDFQSDQFLHEQMFEVFTRLIPIDYRADFKEFLVFHGNNDLLGFVEPLSNDLRSWNMGLAIESANDIDNIQLQNDFVYTVIHEFAHVLTLNADQVDPTTEEFACNTFHTGEGCSFSNSYINALFELGWKDIYEEFEDLNFDGYEIYDRYPDRFVTEYAATNPGEDVAEVFSVFVTQNNRPTGNSIADQKIRLMYEYPELVTLRDHIRKDATARRIQPGSWVKDKSKRPKHVCLHAH